MSTDSATSLDDIDAGLAQAEPKLTIREQRLAIATYRLLSTGEPVTVQFAAAATNLPAADVDQVLHSWPSVYFDHDDRVIGFWGLALAPMPHRLRIGRADLFAWCAWDPLFLALIVGPMDVATNDPVTGDTITYHLDRDATITGLSHRGSMLSFLRRDRPWDDDVMATFCHFIVQFTGPDSAERWTNDHPGTFTMSFDDALELARRHVARSFVPALGLARLDLATPL